MTRTRAEVYLVCITLVWGSTFIITKILLQNVTPFVYTALRFSLASIIFIPFFLYKKIRLSKASILSGLFLGVLLFLGFISQTVGLKYTSASKSAFITGMSVVFTPFFQYIIYKSIPTMGNILGIFLVLIGLFLMTSPFDVNFNVGDAWTLLCALIFSIYIVYINVFSNKFEPSLLTIVQFLTNAILAIVFMYVLERPILVSNTLFFALMAYMVIMPTVVALFVMAKYQKYTTPTRSAVIYSLEPLFASIFAYLLKGEMLNLRGIIGGFLILIGVLVSELTKNANN